LATISTNQPITNIYDFNWDGAVGTAVIVFHQTHGTANVTGLVVINIPMGGPFAPLPRSGKFSRIGGAANGRKCERGLCFSQ
jgi:hypothetical protein